ncbi:MAG: sigma 54-interacting transcriptional regulator, partial [Bryobacterales bacterium]|nr:sigma 54-interacting transcriptional regulator [Bryobacterales bacterium]
LCAPPELASINSNFSKAMAGVPPPQLQTRLVTRSNQIRHVLWSTVLLRGHDGQPSGTISVGADITDRVLAEAGRDQAMSQLAVLKADLEAENEYLKMELATSVDAPDVIGKSDGIRYVLHKVAQVAGTQATVLIEGETGVGKELVARAIHRSSPRAQMPFIRVNCAALPPSLVESELFGHERGAFTGADRQRQGRFEMADGGTILLDEIGEISLDIQAKLLRVLQEGEFDRVGGVKTRKTDVRVIASTNRDLRQDVAQGRFREDLYYRLQVFPISVPPLRDRRDDIPLLVQAFVQRICQKHGKPVLEVSMKTIRQLSERDWPGNIRELENVIERAVITNSGSVLNLSEESGRGGQPLMNGPAAQSLTLDEVERNHIEQVLRRTGGQIAGEGGAAQILGLHPNTLRGRMAKLGVARPKSAEKAASA